MTKPRFALLKRKLAFVLDYQSPALTARAIRGVKSAVHARGFNKFYYILGGEENAHYRIFRAQRKKLPE